MSLCKHAIGARRLFYHIHEKPVTRQQRAVPVLRRKGPKGAGHMGHTHAQSNPHSLMFAFTLRHRPKKTISVRLASSSGEVGRGLPCHPGACWCESDDAEH